MTFTLTITWIKDEKRDDSVFVWTGQEPAWTVQNGRLLVRDVSGKGLSFLMEKILLAEFLVS